MTITSKHSKIIGRDDFIHDAWESLTSNSLYMNDLRRIGKTQIIRKMDAELPANWLSAFSDLEGVHTAEAFAAKVYKDSAAVLGKKKKALRKMSELLGKAAGTEFMGLLKLPDGRIAPWQDVLRITFEDIHTALKELPDTQMVFLWDEVPYMLENIMAHKETENGIQVAMQVLDLLRELSQSHDNIRLLLTGSIGIHHVLHSLWDDGYKGSPLNHMNLIQPGPLEPEQGTALATREIHRRALKCEDIGDCASALSDLVNHVPFYIEKLAARLPRNIPITPQAIEVELEKELRSDNSDWDIDYYRRRVKVAFPKQHKLVFSILDRIAQSESAALSFEEVRQLVGAQMELDDEVLRDHLKLLCMDHYLTRDEANRYRFYLSFIRRWWQINRSL